MKVLAGRAVWSCFAILVMIALGAPACSDDGPGPGDCCLPDSGPDGDGGAVEDSLTDAGSDAGNDAGPDGGGDSGPLQLGTLTVDCDVPYVLDGSKLSDVTYMMSHYTDLVLEYCILGSLGDVDLNSYGTKMYFGSHDATEPKLQLTQSSMNSLTSPAYSVRIIFNPDTAVTVGSVWPVSVNATDAGVVKHITQTEVCLFAVGTNGSLTFSKADNVTAVEGGSFAVAGSIDMANPKAMPPAFCAAVQGTVPCCP